MLTFGSLFSGIEGIGLGLERAGMRCLWQVEINGYATRVLNKRYPDVIRYGDIRAVGKHNLAPVDLICGGFPCQDISNAGKRAGIEGERSGLWSEFYRVVCELRPRYVLVENVAALLVRGIDRVLADLAASGYDAEWQVLPASAFGAPHLRERVFIVAYAQHKRLPRSGHGHEPKSPFYRSLNTHTEDVADSQSTECEWSGNTWSGWNGFTNSSTVVADPDRQGLAVGQVFGSYARAELAAFKRDCSTGTGQWAIEPQLGRVVDGVSSRVDRLKCLGNAVVPQITEYIGRCIIKHANY